MTKRNYLIVVYDGDRNDPERWIVVERNRHGFSTLSKHATKLDAQRALASFRKSAVPRLSALFPFGGKG